jgi:hypothetical protein
VGGSGSRDEFGLNDIVVNAEGSSAVIDPSDFNALTISETQIDLSWLLNPGGNNVMIAANTTLSFGTPSGAYSVNDPIGSANVIYNGPLTFFSHQNINPGIQYYYKIWSVNASNNYSIGVVDSAYTQFLEPTGHPSALAAVTNGPTAITVSWTDSDASKYLVKGSTAGYEAITTPVDGVAEPDAALVRNVNSGVQQWQFNNLEPATPYYFKIFPYNGIGTAINYKINETIPQAMATTDPFTLALLISEVADPADSANAKFVEIYNASAAAIDFSTTPVFFNRQSNGGTVGNFALTGILSAGGKRVYAYVNTPLDPDTAKFLNAYGIEADYYNSGVSGNGNDGYFLSYGAPVTAGGYLFESFGQLNINGTGEPWEYTDKKAVRKQNVVIPNKIWTASEWHIPADTVGSKRMTPGNHGGAVTWVGGAGNSWQQRGSNWSSLNGFVPDASNTVIVPDVANDPVIGLPSAVHQLELQSGAVLIIQNTGSLQILGP